MLPQKSVRGPYYNQLIRRMIVTIIGVSFIPVLLIGLTIYYQFKVSYKEKVYIHLSTLVEKHKQQIDSFLNNRLGDIKFVAESFSYDQIRNEAFLKSRLYSLQQSFSPIFVDLGVINASGRQVAYAGPFKLSRVEYADALWFQNAMANREVISDVFLGVRGFPHFIVAVKREVGNHSWVVRATIDFVAFNDLVENIRVGETGFAFVLNKKGELQTKPRFNFNPPEGCYGHFFDCDPAGNEGVVVERRRDQAGIVSIYATALLKNRDWLLVYQQHEKDAFADQLRAEKIVLIIFAMGLISIILMSLLISVRMVNRIAVTDTEKAMMNKQIVESGKLASLGELATGVAHEINNPVAIMVEEAGWIEDILADLDIEKQEPLAEIKRALNQINTQGKRCKDITTKLLSFARGSGSTIRHLQINHIIEEVINLSAQRAKYANVSVNSDLQPDLPEVSASETEMHQVFLNLVNNALYAMEKTGGTIEFESRLDGSNILVTVTDTGPGIPEGILDRIFDPFFSTKPVGQGTGLGLSICYGIIRKMNGDIQVESTMGKGSAFMITLPVNQEPASSEAG